MQFAYWASMETKQFSEPTVNSTDPIPTVSRMSMRAEVAKRKEQKLVYRLEGFPLRKFSIKQSAQANVAPRKEPGESGLYVAVATQTYGAIEERKRSRYVSGLGRSFPRRRCHHIIHHQKRIRNIAFIDIVRLSVASPGWQQ